MFETISKMATISDLHKYEAKYIKYILNISNEKINLSSNMAAAISDIE